ncbi:MAG: SAM-dependent methyltransferase [Candidatus Sericytochromatia bacterium]|nr:SAM-dependent methyltransferase [Candidatus Sericytochromatia bacterium]
MEFNIRSVAEVINNRDDLADDFWGEIISEIRLSDEYSEESFAGIEEFSHLEIFFVFDKAINNKIVSGSEHPRENKDWPKVGIFAQRKKNRPNFIGSTIVELIKKQGKSIFVKNLDAINKTPIIDIKPVMKEFLPTNTIQPQWSVELMKDYWK